MVAVLVGVVVVDVGFVMLFSGCGLKRICFTAIQLQALVRARTHTHIQSMYDANARDQHSNCCGCDVVAVLVDFLRYLLPAVTSPFLCVCGAARNRATVDGCLCASVHGHATITDFYIYAMWSEALRRVCCCCCSENSRPDKWAQRRKSKRAQRNGDSPHNETSDSV